MADSLKRYSTPCRQELEEHNCRNSSTGGFRCVDREPDSCGDSCPFQAVNYCEGSSFPTTQSFLIMERVSESNRSSHDCLLQSSEPHSHPEIISPDSQPALGFYPQISSLVPTAESMISNSILPSNPTGPHQSTRTATRVDRTLLDRQTLRSDPNLSSTSFASIVAWRREFNSTTQGDCLHEGDTCTPLPTLIHGHPSHSVTQSVSDTIEIPSTFENITSRFTPSAPNSGRSSPSEYMLSTGLGYTLTPRGNIRQDNNIRNNTSLPAGHRINSPAFRVFRSHSPRGSTSIRSRRISSSSRSLSPLNIGLALYHPSNDGDNLPVLLSPSDRSERDRPPTPVAASEVGSQTLSEDSRSRFIHPGTPIQMQLPELPSLLEATPSEHTDSGDVWLVPNDGLRETTEGSVLFDEEDVFGCDKERAKELLDGLDVVEPNLVRRYEKVRGEDICIICRDTLLPQENEAGTFRSNIQEKLPAVSPVPPSTVPDSSIHAFPCAHLFHTCCLFPWLSIKTTCPTCRLDIDPHSLTLRIRRWFGITDNQDPTYVNVDILGRRIPWHRPSAPSIEEWVHARELEKA